MSEKPSHQLLPNIIAGWFAFLITAIFGFLMPRIILEDVGHDLLGLWDLCWSFIAFVSFSGIGVGSGIAHYIALANSTNEPRRLSGVVWTGTALQIICAVVIGLCSYAVIAWLGLSSTNVGFNLDVKTLATLVACTVGIAAVGELSHNILLGYHQNRTSEYINIAHDVTLACCMLATLSLGSGIIGLAWVTLGVRLVFEFLRVAAVVQLQVSPNSPVGFSPYRSGIQFPVAKRLVWFAGKSSIYPLQELFVSSVHERVGSEEFSVSFDANWHG